ncbi:transcription initiation factor TFIID subunit 4b-like [Trifolium medium]|uniref:Transcription initiation factor TFIID subunit 4b-like n=1 Tax=Trifolium medium TaxID=97028 RepID=A0A392QP84_9FABA|nr:transcription initiation factor TFIID subunit 4b-like [Trifolium medium]
MSNLLITETVNEQPRIQIKSRLPMAPYDQMFPFLTPAIGPDKTNELQALFDKYQRHEIPGHTFFRLMEDIVGEKLLSSATAKLLEHVEKKSAGHRQQTA